MRTSANTKLLQKLKLLSLTTILVWPGVGAALAQEGNTGTDPRDFTSKFMPYMLHTELENGVEVDQLNLFGMYAFNGDMALTYDLPIYKNINIPTVGDTNGIGDFGLRFFYKPPSWNSGKNSHMIGGEVKMPTASEDILGDDVWTLSLMYVFVKDIKLLSPGFMAMMNFYDFDVAASAGTPSVSRFRGRWFIMQPLTRPGPKLTDGLYLLPEFQPVYDFETDEFSAWFAPEFGKAIKGGAIYMKPGWGISNDLPTDREFTFEIGFRKFF